MSAPEAQEAAAPPKSKKMLIIIIAAVLVLVLGGGAAFFFIKKKQAAEEEDGDTEHPAAVVEEKKGPPAYLPMDNMVINLADPGGERVAQIGVTLELSDEHDIEHVKAFLPTIRSEVLMLISQRTADELLSREGKEKLIADIIDAAGKHFGAGAADDGKKKKKDKEGGNPVRGVLFSSFIVQ